MHYNDAKNITDELSMQITIKDNIWLSIGLTLLISPVESPSYHNGFPLDLEDHKNQNGVATDFSVRCDRSPGAYVLKLGTEIPN